ncbi:hypothetical protein DENIS_0841 [Desulfonema ishimotonii]|uniref:Uncharacterized protein n=1 Tax=Desulfonema ishimotonii TaxID=45657 RepID=A0A401FSF6_9BACT|nr:hypothetical protein DENIS_0841 [Desulfonema ishimotonii]
MVGRGYVPAKAVSAAAHKSAGISDGDVTPSYRLPIPAINCRDMFRCPSGALKNIPGDMYNDEGFAPGCKYLCNITLWGQAPVPALPGTITGKFFL